jgi:hypothetical protein
LAHRIRGGRPGGWLRSTVVPSAAAPPRRRCVSCCPGYCPTAGRDKKSEGSSARTVTGPRIAARTRSAARVSGSETTGPSTPGMRARGHSPGPDLRELLQVRTLYGVKPGLSPVLAVTRWPRILRRAKRAPPALGRYGNAVWYPPDPDEPMSELYRLMTPRRQRSAGNGDLGEALDAVRASGSVREALDAASGMVPAPADPADNFSWPGTTAPRQRRWPRCLVRALGRVDVWILVATVAGVVIAYLTLVKPH